jgi:hypothetical protein
MNHIFNYEDMPVLPTTNMIALLSQMSFLYRGMLFPALLDHRAQVQ